MSRVIQQAVQFTQNLEMRNAWLSRNVGYFPEVFVSEPKFVLLNGNQVRGDYRGLVFLATHVRKKWGKKWHKILCVEQMHFEVINGTANDAQAEYEKALNSLWPLFIRNTHVASLFGNSPKLDPVDSCQLSEKDRMIKTDKILNYYHNKSKDK